jgi:hypothetical protein
VIRRRRHAGWFGTTGVVIALVAAGPLRAADAPKPPPPVTAEDEELLEFLGGADGELDEDEEGWLDFLSSTDIRRIAGAKK